MTDDPITAVLQQLADHHDQLTQLTELITGIGDTLREHQAALAKLAETPRRRPGRLPPEPAARVVEARGRRPGRTHRPPPRLGRAGLPPRLRPPGRHPRPLLELARPVPVRPGHPVRPVVRPVPPARTHPADAVGPSRIPGPHPARPGRPADHRNHPLRPHPAPPAAGRHDRRHPPPGPRLRPPRLARLPLPARPEDPRHHPRLQGRHHRRAADHRMVRPRPAAGTWPSPPAPPAPTS